MLPRRVYQDFVKRRRYSKFSLHHSTNFLHRFGNLFLWLVILVTLHTLAMVLFEDLSFGDALWLSLTTITTVGYGDFSAESLAGRVSSTLFIYSVGITLLAQLGVEYVEYRLTIREMKNIGRWKWKNMNAHILIINAPADNPDKYLLDLVGQLRQEPELSELPIQILSDAYCDGLPEGLSDFGVVHYAGVGQDSDSLQAANAHLAAYVILLASEPSSPAADSLNFDILCRLQELKCPALILSEVCNDANRARMQRAGAAVMVRPMRAYPGLLVRTLIAPGTEAVFENLFTYHDDHMKRCEHEFTNLKWSEIVCRFVTSGLGTPMAYIHQDGINVHPLPDTLCSGSAIITLLNESQRVDPDLLAQCLASPKAINESEPL